MLFKLKALKNLKKNNWKYFYQLENSKGKARKNSKSTEKFNT